MTRIRILVMSALSLGCVAWYRPVYPVVVSGPSMSPTYPNGQVVLATAATRPLQRGDVVVLTHDDETLIKRIAFLPGDSYVQVKEPGGLWFTPLVSGSLKSLAGHRMPIRRVTVPQGMIYVVGDNFAFSTDSNAFGPVLASSVVGIVIDQRRPAIPPTFLGARYSGPAG